MAKTHSPQHTLADLHALSMQTIPNAKRSDEVRDVLLAIEPTADASLTREALALVLAQDPTYWLNNPALRAWLGRVGAGLPELSLLAWLASMLVEWGLLDGDERQIKNEAPLGLDAYREAIRFLWERPTSVTTYKVQSWLVLRAKREPSVLLPVAIEILDKLCTALPLASAQAKGDELPRASQSSLMDLAFTVRNAVCTQETVPPAVRISLARTFAAIASLDLGLAGNFAERLRSMIPECVNVLLAPREPATKALLEKLLCVWDVITLEENATMTNAIASAHSAELAKLYLFACENGIRARDLLFAVRDEKALVPALCEALDKNDERAGFALFYAVPLEEAAAAVNARLPKKRKPKKGSMLADLAETVARKRG